MNKRGLIGQLRLQGFSENIVKAFEKIKREDFLPEHLHLYAYEDIALPIEEGQTLSQPSTIAFVLSLLDLKDGKKILEIGAGSGYVLALISAIISNGEIYGVEIKETAAVKAKQRLSEYKNIHIIHRDGSHGYSDAAPYDRILVSAASPDMSIVANLTDQLADQGILIAPVKNSLIRAKKSNGKIETQEHPGFAFVPLVKGKD